MARRFYDLQVQPQQSGGDGAFQPLMDRADRLGWDGIVVADHVSTPDDLAAPDADADTDLDVRQGATIQPTAPGELSELLGWVRDRVDVVVVHGGDAAVNRAACEDGRVDVLVHPGRDRRDSGVDHVMVKEAERHRVAFGLVIRRLLDVSGKQRAHRLNGMRELVRLADHADAPVVTVTGARSADQMRAPRELAAFPALLGRDTSGSFDTVSTVPRRVIERADRVNAEETVRPGVREVDADG